MWGRDWERGGVRERREPARDATWAAVDHRILVCVRSPGWRGERALEPKRCVVEAQPQVCGRGVTSGRKNRATGLPEPSPTEGRARSRGTCVSAGDPGSVAKRVCRTPRAPGQKEKKATARRGTDSRGGAPDARPKTHALQNDTPRPEPAPAGMLQGLPIAAERRAVGWGEMGRGAGEGVATSTTCFVLRGRSRAARSGLCRPPPGYFSTFPG